MRSESRRGTDSGAPFLHRLTEKHDVADTEFLVDSAGYSTAIACHDLSGHPGYEDRTHIEEWFQTVSMRIDRFHSFLRDSKSHAKRWLRRFNYYYNRNQPNQADGRTPPEEVLNHTVPVKQHCR